MKKLQNLALALIVILACSCKQGGKGELIGVQNRPSWQPIDPYGMVYIPSGTLHVGNTDQDVNFSHVQRPKAISIQGFYMDDTEITNNEYRQFVNWVRDSIVLAALDIYIEPEEDEGGSSSQKWIDWERRSEIDWSGQNPLPSSDEGGEGDQTVEDLSVTFKIVSGFDDKGKEKFESYSENIMIKREDGGIKQTLGNRRQLNTTALMFEYQWIDWNKAANEHWWNSDRNRNALLKAENERLKRERSNNSINKEISNKEVNLGYKDGKESKEYSRDIPSYLTTTSVNIFPDTLAWKRDFTYSYNEPMVRNYFWHPAFDDYPVVGIAWLQANAFCFWRTNLWNSWETVNSEDFRLPTEHEWEYAARGGLQGANYPWGTYYTRNAKGCFLANFKPGRGDYPSDGGLYTVRADAYFPNDYGLYNMAGNVAEWTSSAYDENSYRFMHDLQPDVRRDAIAGDMPAMKRKVIRGGSWKDIAYFIQTGTRHWEYQDSTKSYIGFRCVLTFLGRL